jgi:hypothetical protein
MSWMACDLIQLELAVFFSELPEPGIRATLTHCQDNHISPLCHIISPPQRRNSDRSHLLVSSSESHFGNWNKNVEQPNWKATICFCTHCWHSSWKWQNVKTLENIEGSKVVVNQPSCGINHSLVAPSTNGSKNDTNQCRRHVKYKKSWEWHQQVCHHILVNLN